MILLRAALWLGLVAYLVPYKTVDPSDGTFAIDEKALMARVAELPNFCEKNPRVCAQVRALGKEIGTESVQTAKVLTQRLRQEQL